MSSCLTLATYTLTSSPLQGFGAPKRVNRNMAHPSSPEDQWWKLMRPASLNFLFFGQPPIGHLKSSSWMLTKPARSIAPRIVVCVARDLPARSAHPRKFGPHPAKKESGGKVPSSLITRTSNSSCSIQPPGLRFLRSTHQLHVFTCSSLPNQGNSIHETYS